MPLSQSGDQPLYTVWQIYDAVFMEMSAQHPRLSISEESDLKGRLLKAILVNSAEQKPVELVRLFREALDGAQIILHPGGITRMKK